MGEAKRRRQQDSSWGQPDLYTLRLRDAETSELIADIKFPVPRRDKHGTHERACATAIVFMQYFCDPQDASFELIEELMGVTAAADIASLWDGNSRCWAELIKPNGQPLLNTKGKPVIFATDEDTAADRIGSDTQAVWGADAIRLA